MEKTTFRTLLENFKHQPLDESGYTPDEVTWSDKNIVLSLLEARATEVVTALNSAIDLSDFMVQTLTCVPVEELDRSNFPSIPASGCYWLRSKIAIPKFIRMLSVTGIVASSINPRFTYIPWDRFQYIPQSRVKSMANGRYWSVREVPGEGYYLYLYGDRFLETIAVSAIWDNPMEVEAFPVCWEVNLQIRCNPLDVDCYTDPWMRDIMMTKTWQKLLPVRDSAPDDKKNDDKHVDSRRQRS